MGRLIDADEYEKRIKPYDTEDVMDKALYNFAHEKLITTSTAQKISKWINQDEGSFYPISCSNCHKEPLLDTYGNYVFSNYCPHCGADMRGDQNAD